MSGLALAFAGVLLSFAGALLVSFFTPSVVGNNSDRDLTLTDTDNLAWKKGVRALCFVLVTLGSVAQAAAANGSMEGEIINGSGLAVLLTELLLPLAGLALLLGDVTLTDPDRLVWQKRNRMYGLAVIVLGLLVQTAAAIPSVRARLIVTQPTAVFRRPAEMRGDSC